MDDLDIVKQRVREAQVSEPPAPWTHLGHAPIEGITEIGFAEDSDLLLVLSGHGREILDGRSGRRVAQDFLMEHRSSWYGAHELVAPGFGPLSGRNIRLAGAFGGGLLNVTRDGWVAARVPIDWPDEHLLLLAPFNSIHQPAAEFWKLASVRDPVAWGFSYTGHTLVAATAEGLELYGR